MYGTVTATGDMILVQYTSLITWLGIIIYTIECSPESSWRICQVLWDDSPMLGILSLVESLYIERGNEKLSNWTNTLQNKDSSQIDVTEECVARQILERKGDKSFLYIVFTRPI